MILLLILTIANVLIYSNRDHFQYQPFRSYGQLYGDCNEACVEQWKQDFSASPAAERQEAARISDSLLSQKNATTLQRIQQLSTAIHEKFRHRHGYPTASFLQLSPVQQYRTLQQPGTTEKLWCGVYTAMFTYLAWSQNITTRSIEVQVPGNAHVVSECYVPELAQWVMTDPTYGMPGVQDNRGKWLDLQSFRAALRAGRALYVVNGKDGKNNLVPLDTSAFPIQVYYRPAGSRDLYYHHTSLQDAYKPVEKLKRYLLPVSWYDIYNTDGKTNLLFWVKIAALLLWVISFIAYCRFLIRRRKLTVDS